MSDMDEKIPENPTRSAIKAKENVLEALVKGLANEKEEWQLQHWCLEKKLDELYDAYEAGGPAPTREVFIQMLQEDTEIPERDDLAEKVKALDPDPFAPAEKKSRKKAGIITAVIVVVLTLCAGGAWLFAQPDETGSAGAVRELLPGGMTEASEVKLTLTAEGVTEASTKAKIKVTNVGEEESTEAIGEMEVNANEEISLGVLPKGNYALTVTTAPVNEDGTTYELPEKATEFEVKGDREPVALAVTLKQLATEDMTEEQLENSAKALESSGKAEAANNVKNKAAEKASSSSSSNKGSSSSGSSASGSSSGNSSSGGSSSGGSSSGSSSKPSHTHNWVAQYKQEQKPIYKTETIIVCACGKENPGRDHVANCPSGGSTHNEYRDVISGYDTVQILTGYKCSSCGATK